MSWRKKETVVTERPSPAATPAPALPVDVETYAISTGAGRLRALEVEIVASFEEWAKAQTSSAEKHVLVEFSMSPWMQAAWKAWQIHRRDV